MKKKTAVIAAIAILALLILAVTGLQLLTASVNRTDGRNQAAVTQRKAPDGPAFAAEKLPEFQPQAPRGPGLTGLLGYFLLLIPGLSLFALLLALTRRTSRAHRIWLYILAFILIRDLMTPQGLWTLGSDPVFWIRFAADGPLLALLAAGSLGMAAGLHLFERRYTAAPGRSPFPWFRHGRIQPLLAGILGALAVSAPVLLLHAGILPGERGGPFPLTLAPALLAVALAGNLLEELLFRGYLQQDLLDQGLSPLQAALASGIAFGFAHSFLAFTVTSAGLPLLLFALWEGIICGLLRMRWGLTAAVLTHGLAVWLIALL